MNRRAIVLLMIAVLWQSMALVGYGLPKGRIGGLHHHHALHGQAKAHHHHSDGSMKVDKSAKSVLHLAGDQLNQAPIQPAVPALAALALASEAPHASGSRAAPNPFIEGPLRPPRRTA
jgi:hypothetical protein